MPTGLIIMQWNERIGAEIVANYPNDVMMQPKTLMQVYAQHEYSSEAGYVTLRVGALNLISYYTGPENRVYLILLLNDDEEGEDYEEGLLDISHQVMESISNIETVKALVRNLYLRLSVYPTLAEEQRLGVLFQDEIKYMIMKRFREEVAIQKSELDIWLKDVYKRAVIFNVDGLIESFLKLGLIRMVSIKGGVSDMAFFVQDIMMLRRPPVELIKDPVDHHLPRSLKKVYIGEVRKFFKDYKVEEDDCINLVKEVLLDPQCYEVLKLMRQAIVTRDDLEKLRKKGVDDLDKVLSTMYEAKMISVLTDDRKTEYYALINDLQITKFYPAYNLDTILHQYKTKSQESKVLLKALDLMKEEFYLQSGVKS